MIRTRVLLVDRDEPEPEAIAEAADVLRRGGLVAFATETVYGLGAVATDAVAVRGIFEAKGRPSNNPLIVHVSGIDQAREYTTNWNARADLLARRFWPGPLTLVLPKTEAVPTVVAAGGATVGLRVPAATIARRLIERVGLPVAAPSANRSNRISPTQAEHVLADLDGRVHLILDSGPADVGLESTVLDVTTDPPRVLRPGPITPDLASQAIGAPVVYRWEHPETLETGPLASPGMLSVHYAPTTRAVRVPTPADLNRIEWPSRVGLIAFQAMPEDVVSGFAVCVIHADPAEAARGFYRSLHELDACKLDLIVAVEPPAEVAWDALRDRLRRAAIPSPG